MPRPELSTLRYPNLWQGCVGAWCPSQSGATGYRLFDDSGNNNHGAFNNLTYDSWERDDNQLSIRYNGFNSSVRTQASNALNITGELTLAAWVKYSAGQGNRGIVAKSGNATQYHIGTGSADNRTLAFWIRSGGVNYSAITTRIYNTNEWHLIVGVYDRQNLILSMNGGKETIVTTVVPGDIESSSPPVYIGSLNNNTGSFNGLIGNCFIWNRALRPYEIQQLASSRGAAYERSRGRKKAYVPGYRITAPSRIQTGSARTIDGTDTESLSRGLVGAWCPSLGASGYRLLDRSGYGNHGTLTNMDPGTDWVPSGGKLALDFDGVNDYVNASVSFSQVATSKRFTFACWIKTSASNNNAYPVSLGSTSSDSPIIGFRIDPGGTGQVIVLFRDDAVNLAISSPGSFSILDGTWKLLTGVADGSNVAMYINGVLYGATGSCTSLGTTSINRLTIGALGRTSVLSYFNGQIDDVRIYNRVLTPSEIRLLYTGGRGVGLLPESKPKRARIVAFDNQDKISVPARVLTNTDSLKRGLVGHWSPSLSGPQGNRLMDLSGQNNHGTLTNMDYQTDYVPSTDKGGRMALDFDGSNDYVSIASLTPALGFSFSAWFKASATTKARHSIFSNADDFGPDIYLHLENVTASVYQMNFYNGTAYLGPSSTFTLDFNFHHYCWTTDIGGNVYYYADGVYLGKATGSWTPINRNKQASLGAVPALIGSSFTAWGTLDDCRRYNRTLTPNEIRLLAQSRMPERATPQRTRMAYWSSGLVSYLRRRTYNSILGSGVIS